MNRCIQMDVLSDDEIYGKMVRFRNFIVHRYEHIEADVLIDMVNERLSDFEQFRNEVLTYVKNA